MFFVSSIDYFACIDTASYGDVEESTALERRADNVYMAGMFEFVSADGVYPNKCRLLEMNLPGYSTMDTDHPGSFRQASKSVNLLSFLQRWHPKVSQTIRVWQVGPIWGLMLPLVTTFQLSTPRSTLRKARYVHTSNFWHLNI